MAGSVLGCSFCFAPDGKTLMTITLGIITGVLAWCVVRLLLTGIYTVDQNERAVVTTLGRAERIGERTTLEDPIAESLNKEEQERYIFPQVKVVQPGFYWKLPWQKVHKVSIATETTNMAYD